MTAAPPDGDELQGRLPAVTSALAARAAEHDRSGAYPGGGIAAVHDAGLPARPG